MASQLLLDDDEVNSTRDSTAPLNSGPTDDYREANLGQGISSRVQGDINPRAAHSPTIELEYLYLPSTQLFLRGQSAGTEASADGSTSWHNSRDSLIREEVQQLYDHPANSPVSESNDDTLPDLSGSHMERISVDESVGMRTGSRLNTDGWLPAIS